jgi:uncharacterized repeat protein (TIGR01451 family)
MRTTCVVVIVLSIASSARAACPDLATASNFAVGTHPWAVAAADFDGDGRPDLAVVNSDSNSVSVLLATGAGSFAAAVSYATGNAPVHIATGDFNGDGRIDLAIANNGGNSVTVLTNNGVGAFPTSATYAAHTAPFFIIAADLNRDGRLDLATSNSGSNDVSILLGNIAGGFDKTNFAAGTSPRGVVAGDFDRDGDLDLAVADSGSSQIAILSGNGAGAFAAPSSIAIPTKDPGVTFSAPVSIASGDFNRDGKLDLAVVDDNTDALSVLIANGAGTFAAAVLLTGPAGASEVVAADLTGDGKLDLVASNQTSSTVAIWTGNGSGAFGGRIDLPGGAQSLGIALADFNADGKPDLALPAYFNNSVAVMLNTGACFANCGTFGGATTFAAGSGPSSIAAGDFNRDGFLDVAIANRLSGNVTVRLGDGAGSFGSPSTPLAGLTPLQVVIADFNRDAKLDLAVVNSGSDSVSILAGDGLGGFASAVNFAVGSAPSGPQSLTVGDFNKDGAPDLAVSCATSKEVAILLNTGSFGAPAFNASTIPSIGSGSGPRGIASADFNHDGNPDLAIVDYGDGLNHGAVIIRNGNGIGNFSDAGSYTTGVGPLGIWLGDFNKDGSIDLAIANSLSNTATILFGSASGAFGTPAGPAAGFGPTSGATADIDNDGNLDLLITDTSNNTLTVLLGNASGSFATASVPTYASANPAAVVAADFNRDGKPDFIVANGGSNDMDVRLNSCPPPDLTATKSHNLLQQGATGAYTISVSNAGSVPSLGVVSVTDALPAGLTATAISGTGWTCTLATLKCTRSDALAPSAFFPQIIVAVNVANNAPASVINTATLSGGADVTPGNNTASDPTNITQRPDLTIAKSHTGDFFQGQTAATYSIVVTNAGGLTTSGTVTVTDTLPTGLTATAMAGTGWNCTLGTRVCTRADALTSGNSYEPITLTVSVASNAATSLTNSVTVSGGSQQTDSANNTATDPTTIQHSSCDLTITQSQLTNFTQGRVSAKYTLTVSNLGPGATSGAVTVTNAVPTGFKLSTIGGTGWTCRPATATCTRADALGTGSYPVITVVVNISDTAPASVTNTATVSGGAEINTSNDVSSEVIVVNQGALICGRFDPVSTVLLTELRGVVVGDFDGNGANELVVGDNGTSLTILTGDSSGHFTVSTSFGIVNQPSVPIAGDFNGDGNLDVAVANGNGEIAVFRGAGNLTFAAGQYTTVGTAPRMVASGDFNGDGKLDLATANNSSNNTSVLIGNGDGTFAAAINYATNTGPTAIAIGDFNGDGKADLAVTTASLTVSILINNGNGTFAPRSDVTIHGDPRSIVSGDWNGDGKTDIAIAHFTSAEISVLIGNGNVTFATPVYSLTSAGASALAAGDLNDDGIMDFAVSCTGTAGVMFGAGDGTFAAPINHPVGLGPVSIAIGQLNADGKPDIVTANDAGTSLSLLFSACALVDMTKSHTGNFTQGQTGATYTLDVRNTSNVPTVGTVTVAELPPPELTVTSMAGSGWTCPDACTRNDALEPGAHYPPITVTVNVASNAGATVENLASVTLTNVVNYRNDFATVNPSGLIAPTRLTATAASTSLINVTWDAVTTAVSYQVFRSDHNGAYAPIATIPGTSYPDPGRTASTTYLYRVYAVNGAAAVSAPSNVDLATTIVFTDDPPVIIKALHQTELRAAVNAVRTAAGLPNATYTNAIAVGSFVRAVDTTELRSRLDAARTIIGVPAIVYTNPLATGSVVRAVHLQEVRAGVR